MNDILSAHKFKGYLTEFNHKKIILNLLPEKFNILDTSKIWLSKIYDTPKGVIFWLRLALLSVLTLFLIAELTTLFAFGWNNFSPVFQLKDIVNSVAISIGSLAISHVIGISLALLLSNYRFAGSTVFSWALLLPLILPTYVYSYTYDSFFGYAGPWHELTSNLLNQGNTNPLLFDTKNIFWVIIWSGLSTLPFVYITFITLFKSQVFIQLEIAKTLKQTNWVLLKKVIYPLLKPLLPSSIFFVFILVFNDYGAAKLGNVNTLTIRFIDTIVNDSGADINMKKWIGITGIIIAILFMIKTFTSKNNTPQRVLNPSIQPTKKKLSRRKGIYAFLGCLLLLVVSFILPVTQLIRLQYNSVDYSKFLIPVANTVLITLLAVFATLVLKAMFSILYSKKSYAGIISKIGTPLKFITQLPGFIIGIIVITFFQDFYSFFFDLFGSKILAQNTSIFFILTLILACSIFLLGINLHLNQLDLFHESEIEIAHKKWFQGNIPLFERIKLNFQQIRSSIIFPILIILSFKELSIFLMSENAELSTLSGYGFNLARAGLLSSSSAVVLSLLVISLVPFLILVKNIKS